MKIRIKDLKDRLPDHMEIIDDDGSSIFITRTRRGVDIKCSYPILRDPGEGAVAVLEECGKPASVMMGNNWFCERHANMELEDD